MFDARNYADIAAALADLRKRAGGPSYAQIVARISEVRASRGVAEAQQSPPRITVYDCFNPDRKRFDVELVVDIGRALGLDADAADELERACWAVRHDVDAARIVHVRAELPDPPLRFVGRTDELATLVEATAGGVQVVHGMGGSGKTELACAAARRLLEQGDIELAVFADLRGFAADRPPADPAAAFDAIVRTLGAEPHRLPSDPAARGRAYRDLLVERNALLLLDDAASAEQVTPLLPDDPSARVVITSRRALADELAKAGVASAGLHCGVLDTTAATEFLRAAARPTSAWDDDDVARVAQAVGHLPLALGVVASRITAKPDWSVADHAASLVDWHGDVRVDEAVNAVLDQSHASMSSAASRALRLLASQPFGDFGLDTAAAAIGVDVTTARTVVAELVGASMATHPAPDRVAFHDLVRVHARSRSLDEDRPSDRDRALAAVLAHFVVMARAAAVASVTRPLDPPRYALPGDLPQLDEQEAARWVGAELENLLTASADSCAAVRPTVPIELSESLAWYAERRSRHHDTLVLFDRALAAARHLGDELGEGLVEINRGQSLIRLHDVDAALMSLRRAEMLVAGDRRALTRVKNALAALAFQTADWSAALEHMLAAMELAGADAAPADLAVHHGNVAVVYSRIGDHEQAIDHLHRSADFAVAAGDVQAAAFTWMNLSGAHLGRDDHASALEAAQRAVAICEERSVVAVQSLARNNLAAALFRLGKRSQGIDEAVRALGEARDAADRSGETDVRVNLAEMFLAEGRLDDAAGELVAAHAIAADLGDDYQLGRVRAAQGHVASARGDTDGARAQWSAALEAFDDAVPEAAEVHRALEQLDGAGASVASPAEAGASLVTGTD